VVGPIALHCANELSEQQINVAFKSHGELFVIESDFVRKYGDDHMEQVISPLFF